MYEAFSLQANSLKAEWYLQGLCLQEENMQIMHPSFKSLWKTSWISKQFKFIKKVYTEVLTI